MGSAALLAREALAQGRKRRTAPAPTTELPRVVERDYLRDILRLLSQAKDLVDAELIPQLEVIARLAQTTDSLVADDSYSDRVERTIERLKFQFGRQVSASEFAEIARRAGWRTVNVNRLKSSKQFQALLGIDLARNDDGFAELLKAFTKENVSLIKTVSERYFGEVEQTVLRNARAGVRAERTARELRERFDITKSRAALIARDQTNKLNGDVTKARHTAAGITHYIWRTAKDDIVRHGHAILEGQTFAWNDPPVVDARTGRRAHPGQDYQCRCTAEPVLPGINDRGPGRKAPEKRRASSRRFIPKGVPPSYAKSAVAPSGGFSLDRLRQAFPGGFSGSRLTRDQQVTVRRELNNLLAPEGMVERTVVARAAADEIETLAKEIAASQDPATQASLGARQRELERLLLSANGPRHVVGKFDGTGAATVSVSDSEVQAAGAAALHYTVSGKITVGRRYFKGMVDYARTPPDRRTPEMVRGLHVMVHETVHGHSPMLPSVYQGVGARLEEATTEMAAQTLVEKATPGWRFTSTGRDEGKTLRGAYGSFIAATVRATAESFGLSFGKAKSVARSASIAMRRHTGANIGSIDGYAHHFARQMPKLRREVAKAERAAELDFKVKLERVRQGELGLFARMTGVAVDNVEQLEDPDIKALIAAELEDRKQRAGMAVTEAFRKHLISELAQAPGGGR